MPQYDIFCFLLLSFFWHIYSSLMQMSSPAGSHALECTDQKQDVDKMRKTQQERGFLVAWKDVVVSWSERW